MHHNIMDATCLSTVQASRGNWKTRKNCTVSCHQKDHWNQLRDSKLSCVVASNVQFPLQNSKTAREAAMNFEESALELCEVGNIAMGISKISNNALQSSSPFPLHMPVITSSKIRGLALNIICCSMSKSLYPYENYGFCFPLLQIIRRQSLNLV